MRRVALACFLILVPITAHGAIVVGHYVGPNFPIVIDTNGDGRPSPGDDTIVPEYSVDLETLTFPNPWDDCGPATHNVVNLTPPGGPYTGGYRENENQTETLQANDFDGGKPTGFAMNVEKGSPNYKTGQAHLVDANGDGFYEGMTAGGAVDFDLNFIIQNDYVTIPWSQASALGVEPNDDCGPGPGNSDPQIFIPLADTNNDGKGDSIVMDLNGDNNPDQQFLIGPPLAAGFGTIPTLSQWGLLLTGLGIAVAAWIQIRSHGLGA